MSKWMAYFERELKEEATVEIEADSEDEAFELAEKLRTEKSRLIRWDNQEVVYEEVYDVELLEDEDDQAPPA